MNPKQISVVVFSLLIISRLIVSSVQAEEHSFGADPSFKKRHRVEQEEIREELLEELKLSDSQREALKRFREKSKSLRGRWVELNDLRIELNAMLREDKVNDEQVLSKLDQINKATSALSEERMKGLLVLRKELTKEQFQKLSSALASSKMRR